MNTKTDPKEAECCAKFDPTGWEKKTHVWKNKLFVKDSIPQFFHMPIPWMFGKAIGRMWELAKNAKAEVPKKDFLLLSYDPSPWKSELYMSVTKRIPGASMTTISGTFISRVFDGPYNAVPTWMQDMDTYLKSVKKTAKKYYFYYTTCPLCAKKYGHNYVVIFAQIV